MDFRVGGFIMDWSPKTKIPTFVKHGYAVLRDGDFYADDGNDGMAIVTGEKSGYAERITLKDGAPEWAVDEHKQLIKYFEKQQPKITGNEYESSRNFNKQ